MAEKQTETRQRSPLGIASFRTRQRKRRLLYPGMQKKAARVIGPLEPGIEIYMMAVGQFHAIHVIEAVIDQIGEPVNVDISSWTIAYFEVSRLAHLLSTGKAARIRFITDRSFETFRPDILAELVNSVGRENIRMLRCHAKFTIITNDDWRIVIRTSANLNSNLRMENYEISDDQALAAYMTTIVDEIFSVERPIEITELKAIRNRNADRKGEPLLKLDEPLIDWVDEPLIDWNELGGGIDEL